MTQHEMDKKIEKMLPEIKAVFQEWEKQPKSSNFFPTTKKIREICERHGLGENFLSLQKRPFSIKLSNETENVCIKITGTNVGIYTERRV